jgi:hypothetical protein
MVPVSGVGAAEAVAWLVGAWNPFLFFVGLGLVAAFAGSGREKA